MEKLIKKVKTVFCCLLRIIRIAKSSGGLDALDRRLAGWEEEIQAYPTRMRCDRCGSSDLEPTATEPSSTGRQVAKYRCKACGWETSVNGSKP